MKVSHAIALCVTAIPAIATMPVSSQDQSAVPAHKSNSIYVTTAMKSDHVPAGTSPYLVVTIKNLTDHAISPPSYCNGNVNVYVQREKGEPPTTYYQRAVTRRLLPGEADLPCTLNVDVPLRPGESLTLTWQLSELYDLSAPGKYSVYMELRDSDGLLLRTNAVQFEVESPGK